MYIYLTHVFSHITSTNSQILNWSSHHPCHRPPGPSTHPLSPIVLVMVPSPGLDAAARRLLPQAYRKGREMIWWEGWRFGWSTGDTPRKLTWNLKITPLERKIIFKPYIFRFHVSFRGCIPEEKLTWLAGRATMNEDGKSPIGNGVFFQCHVSFQGGVKKRREHWGKMYWKMFRSWRVGLQFFSMVARLVELSELQFENGFKCFFFAAIMVKLG